MGLLDRFRKRTADETRLLIPIHVEADAQRSRASVIDDRDESSLPGNAVLLGGQGRVEVKGESYYQAALDRVCGGKCGEGHARKVFALLEAETDNPHDANAVAVKVDGEIVGRLGRQDAATYAPLLRELAEKDKLPFARAFIRGGWRRSGGDEGHYGIELELSNVEVLMKSRKVTAALQGG